MLQRGMWQIAAHGNILDANQKLVTLGQQSPRPGVDKGWSGKKWEQGVGTGAGTFARR
jgi:hypothetical protein